MDCRERLQAYLEEQAVWHEFQSHPSAFTAQEVAASEHLPGRMLAKVVMVRADQKLVMLALPAPAQVDLGRAAAALGPGEVRIAEEHEFATAFPDCEAGAMPAFGNLYGVPVHVDRGLTRNERIVMQAGTHHDTVSLRYVDFERLAEPVVGAFASGS